MDMARNYENGKNVVALGMAISEIESLLEKMGGKTASSMTINELVGISPEGSKTLSLTQTLYFDLSKLNEYFARKSSTDQ